MAKTKTEAATDGDVATLPEAEFKSIPLTDIRPDPNQPRRFFDEQAQQELTDSIRENGVLQPVLVRPDPEGKTAYMIVCGERRYRSAEVVRGVFSYRDTIPAVIRELTESEALELQIVENLQRKNVHPMEEAAGFKSLLDHKQLTLEEIAARIGKSIFYVRQRMKLNELIPELQKLYFANRIKAVDALTLSGFNEDAQKEIAKDFDTETGAINISDWYLRKFKGSLSKAPFRLDDLTLDRKMGACIGCKFNSATAALFPDAEKSPVCGNIKCFSHKCDVHFDHELVKAKEEPGVIFINGGYGDIDTKLAKELKKEHIEILTIGAYSGDCKLVEKPETPVLDDYDIDDYDSEEERIQDFNDDMAKFEKDLQAYDAKVAGGKYKKAFVVHGDDKGKYAFVTMNARRSAPGKKDVKAKEAAGDLTLSDIEDEIKRIQDREKRAKELDAEKVHKRVIDAVKADKSINEVPGESSPADIVLIRFLLSDLINYTNRKIISKRIGLTDSVWGNKDAAKYHKQLEELTPQQITFLVRQIMLDKHTGTTAEHGTGYMFRLMAESLGTIPTEAFETEQREIAERRHARVTKRLTELKEKKAELKKAQPKSDSKLKAKAKKKK